MAGVSIIVYILKMLVFDATEQVYCTTCTYIHYTMLHNIRTVCMLFILSTMQIATLVEEIELMLMSDLLVVLMQAVVVLRF